MKTFQEFIAETASEEASADKVNKIESDLKSKGYTRSKDPEGNEYQFHWSKPGKPTHVVNYRHGNRGVPAHWIKRD